MALSAAALSVVLGRTRVLDGIDVSLARGRVTAILGPNGAGKSTLVRTLAGLVAPEAGTVTIDGDPLAALPPRERARRIGYLPQEAAVHWNVAAREIVALGRLPYRSPFAALSAADEGAIAAAMAATDTEHLAGRAVDELSGGERARVLLARVLAGQPEWLLVDEPLASLDPAHQLDLLYRLRSVADAGAGVAIVLHDLAQTARVAHDVLLLSGGRIAGWGPVGEVLTAETIAAVFGVAVVRVDAPGGPVMVPVERLGR